MKTYRRLFEKLCSYDNLFLAYQNASKGKTQKKYVLDFEKNLQNELYKLQWELLTHAYRPRPLTVFTVHDPKTRKISASHFRDRVIHHAIINIIGPIFESRFIHDTFANRKGKGTLAALERFDLFLRKVTENGKPINWGGGVTQNRNNVIGCVFKADIKHYFDTVDHEVLLSILCKRINDKELLDLIRVILENHKGQVAGKGMPLGNLTSQFFANVYLAELDNFVKHDLKAKYYIRYVDDFVILERNKALLEQYKERIESFLKQELKLELHPEKSKIIPLQGGITLLGFRVFLHYRLLKRSNQSRIWKRLRRFGEKLGRGETTKKHVLLSMAGWEGYAKMANTYNLRKRIRNEVNSMVRL